MRTTAWIAGLVAMACRLAWPASANDPRRDLKTSHIELEVTVYIAQSCRVPAAVQRTAQATVSWVFDRIGVSVRFTGSEPRETDTDAIALRLMDHAPGGLEEHVLGLARVGGEDRRQASVFCDRVREFHHAFDWPEDGLLLGYAIAHELGHLLRADANHSLAGVMKACWRRCDALPMVQGLLTFCPADRERIRAVMAQRQLERQVPPAKSETHSLGLPER